MNKISSKFYCRASIVALLCCLFIGNAFAQQGPIAPPAMGEETKGTPAVIEDQAGNEQAVAVEEVETSEEEQEKGGLLSVLGSTKITESKRESGQVYRIELEHSGGSKQYIEEHDSDGKIQSKSNDIEETPNLPKWKLGSW